MQSIALLFVSSNIFNNCFRRCQENMGSVGAEVCRPCSGAFLQIDRKFARCANGNEYQSSGDLQHIQQINF